MTDLISSQMYKKYDEKTIRINRFVYRIRLMDDYTRVIVTLIPVNPERAEVSSLDIINDESHYRPQQMRDAIQVAHDIMNEIEKGIKTDFTTGDQNE